VIIEGEDEPEPEIQEDIQKKSYLDSIKGVLFGSKPEYVEDTPEPEIRKVVLVKPGTEQELKFVLKLMDSLLEKTGKSSKEKFLQTREYKLYKKIRSKYN
jgi:hypothetical protein